MAWTTTKSIAAIRGVLRKVKWKFTEKTRGETTFFTIEKRGELAAVQAVYQPGLFALYLVFGVKPDRKRRAEVIDFANRMNDMAHSGCVVVRDDGKKLAVHYRASIDHRYVEVLDEGYVGSLIGGAMDMVETIDVPLARVAKGTSAERAIAETLEGGVLPIR
ncbi:MAG TPA: hypothetical protein VGH28_10850 [Polyangiaceae bacterium]|jgi:hypothetical protein